MQAIKLSILLLITCSVICLANALEYDVSEPNSVFSVIDSNDYNSSVTEEPASCFQYNGILIEHGVPVYGNYDLEFTLYDTPNDVNLVSTPVIIDDVNIVDGHYRVELDFGSDIFDGEPRWLEIWSRSAGSEELFVMTGSREKLSPVPYALYSNDSGNSSVSIEIVSRNSLDAADGNPTEALYVDDEGNVGIGTINPFVKLDVEGYAKMSGFIMPNNAYSGYVLTSDGLGIGTWRPLPVTSSGLTGIGSANYLPKFTSSSTLGISSIFENSGKIGIGTSSPDTKLEVQGGPIKAAGGLIIETRTSDPSNPVTGQIWLRTDL